MSPKEETTQITTGGKTITQVAELSAVPEVDVVDGTMAAAAQQLNDALVAFGKALADSLRPVVDAIVDTFRNIVDVFRNAWPEYEDEIIRSVATPRQWHLYKHGRPRVRKKWKNQLLKRRSKHKKEVEKIEIRTVLRLPVLRERPGSWGALRLPGSEEKGGKACRQ